jgi:hypothetical protein
MFAAMGIGIRFCFPVPFSRRMRHARVGSTVSMVPIFFPCLPGTSMKNGDMFARNAEKSDDRKRKVDKIQKN